MEGNLAMTKKLDFKSQAAAYLAELDQRRRDDEERIAIECPSLLKDEHRLALAQCDDWFERVIGEARGRSLLPPPGEVR